MTDTGSSLWARLAFGLIGIGLLTAAGVFALSVLAFQGRATQAEGTVTTSNAGGRHPVIRFMDRSGTVTTFNGNGLIFGYQRGDTVAVLHAGFGL